jgi:DNA-binding beta-propeller fold protein YncE
MRSLFASIAALALCPAVLAAQVAVSANDGKSVLVNGATVVPDSPLPDTVTVIDLSVSPPRVSATLRAPASVVGPPQSVAISPDRSLALVTAALKLDPADATKTVPDDRVTVIGLKGTPSVLETLHAGRQPSGVSINAAGTLALVANRGDGTISVFTIAGTKVANAGTVSLDAPDSAPSHVVFTPDGKRALVTRNNDNRIAILDIAGTTVTYAKRDVAAGSKPYGIDVTPDGRLAIAANIGAGATGAADTLDVIELAPEPRVVTHTPVGPVPEGIAISADGRFVAVTVMNGSNQPPSSPLYHPNGLLKVLAIDGTALRPVAEAPVDRWCQGVAWHPNGRSLLVECMVDRRVHTFTFDGKALTAGTPLAIKGGPAGLRARD